MDTWIVVLILGNLAFTGLMIALALYYRLQKDKQRSAERMRVLDRFSSAPELEAFLASPAGQHLFDRFAPPPHDPRRTILLTFGVGLVALLVGGGLFLLTFGDGDLQELLVGGTILLCAGFGILLAGMLSLGLSRRWGMMDRPDHSE